VINYESFVTGVAERAGLADTDRFSCPPSRSAPPWPD
jgi:hypothetical protein